MRSETIALPICSAIGGTNPAALTQACSELPLHDCGLTSNRPNQTDLV